MKRSTHPTLFFLLFATVCFFTTQIHSQVLINEIVSNNESGLQDFEGEYSDWIELYNTGAESINLSGYAISDEIESWLLPDTTIQALSFLLIYASNKNTSTSGELHANFAINSGGERIYLSDTSGETIDQAPYDNLMPDQSLARSEDGSPDWIITNDPTPLQSNNTSTPIAANGLFLNEVTADNSTEEDWLEIYNGNEGTALLTGYYLSDDPENLSKWEFPNISIPSMEIVKINASGLDMEIDGEWHTNFSINREGETIYLSGPFGGLIDFIRVPFFESDFSIGKKEEGRAPGWVLFYDPSPGQLNNTGTIPAEIDFSYESGHYLEELELEITSAEDVEIRYTLNGEEPTANSALLEGPLLLGTRAGEPDQFSIIQCTEEPYLPLVESKKANVVRARAFSNGDAISKTKTKTYLIDPNPQRYSFPIISLVGEPDSFFGEEDGICVFYYGSGRAWEREISMEYIENGELTFSQNCGIRLHGGSTRASKQKSFRLYARSEYGKREFSHSFFANKEIEVFKRLILRAPRGYNGSYYADELSQSLAEDMNLLTQAEAQAVVFLNGEYWGFYHLRERLDKHFIESNYGVDSDSVSMLKNDPSVEEDCEHGDCTSYQTFLNNLAGFEELSDIDYAYVESQIDIDSFIDFLCLNFYCQNNDWPHNNTRIWRTSSSDKWKFLAFDFDFSMYKINHAHITFYFDNLNVADWWYQPASKLFNYEPFQEKFLNRFEFLLHNQFDEENVLEKMAVLEQKIAPEYEEHRLRFDAQETIEDRDSAIQQLAVFAELRPCAIEEDLKIALDYDFELSVCQEIMPPDTINPLDTTTSILDVRVDSSFEIRISEGLLQIDWEEFYAVSEIDLFDTFGRMIWREKCRPSELSFQKSTAEFPAGIYILRIGDGEKFQTKKIHISN